MRTRCRMLALCGCALLLGALSEAVPARGQEAQAGDAEVFTGAVTTSITVSSPGGSVSSGGGYKLEVRRLDLGDNVGIEGLAHHVNDLLGTGATASGMRAVTAKK